MADIIGHQATAAFLEKEMSIPLSQKQKEQLKDSGNPYFLYDLLPHNKDIQSPAIQDAISIMNQMGERQTEYIVKILKIYQASHQD